MSCVQTWTNQGAPYLLVVDYHRYRLSGDESDLQKNAGSMVTVAGDLVGNEVAVSTVEPTSRHNKM
jgi:hypothetical protein